MYLWTFCIVKTSQLILTHKITSIDRVWSILWLSWDCLIFVQNLLPPGTLLIMHNQVLGTHVKSWTHLHIFPPTFCELFLSAIKIGDIFLKLFKELFSLLFRSLHTPHYTSIYFSKLEWQIGKSFLAIGTKMWT